MRFQWVLIFVNAAYACNSNDPKFKDDLDPNDAADNAFLWQNLFIKLNTVLNATEKLGQGLADVNQRLDTLTKRQEDHENRITKLMENAKTCPTDPKESEWTTILRRQDGSVNFNRKWNEYKNGFGNPRADFFIGLEKLHTMTTNGSPQELLIILIDFENETRFAKYDLFRVGSETEKYAIKELGTYSGDAGDGMGWHRGKSFSTVDVDNNTGKIRNCPDQFKGGWWFHDPCYSGHLHGPYRQQKDSKTWGVSWHPWRGWDYSVKYAEMMIRPKQ